MITNRAARNITFSWSPPDEESRYGNITSYTLSCSTVEGGLSGPQQMFDDPPVGGVVVAGFKPYTDYNCTMTASNSAGTSPPASDLIMTLSSSMLTKLSMSVTS